LLFGIERRFGEQRLDLGPLEAGERQVVAGIRQLGQFQREPFLVPAGVQRQAVVGEHQGALLRRREVREFNDRHLLEPEPACCGQPPVPGDDAVVTIDQDRVGEAELRDGSGDLGDLRLAVRARVARVGDQRLDLAVLDGKRVQGRSPKAKPAGRCRRAGRVSSGSGDAVTVLRGGNRGR
jgi:hypothetical protein